MSANNVDDKYFDVKLMVREEVNSLTLNLSDSVYDALVTALISENTPLIEHDVRSHKRRDAVTPTEFIERLITQTLKRNGFLR
jgi:hypothetical protein